MVLPFLSDNFQQYRSNRTKMEPHNKYTIIYSFKVNDGKENEFIRCWKRINSVNLDRYVDEFISKGLTFEEMPNDKKWLWRDTRLKDPDQNQLILYFAGENRLHPPRKIKNENK